MKLIKDNIEDNPFIIPFTTKFHHCNTFVNKTFTNHSFVWRKAMQVTLQDLLKSIQNHQISRPGYIYTQWNFPIGKKRKPKQRQDLKKEKSENR